MKAKQQRKQRKGSIASGKLVKHHKLKRCPRIGATVKLDFSK